jgi:multidrug efflux pump subunit AcrA (membrane-fusion protein)
MKKIRNKILFIALMFIGFSACKQSVNMDEASLANAKTPVTVTNINIEPIAETFDLRATSVFQKKVAVKANANGYIDYENVNIGDEVTMNQVLFTIKTKEANALANTAITQDTSLHFSGVIKIKAQKSGIITTLNHLKGDYVQDGDQLGIISERNSLLFIMEVPFELHSYIKVNHECEIFLSDDQVVKGEILGALPLVDAVSQTQSYVVKPLTELKLPENLIAKIRIIKNIKQKAAVLPKLALLSNETQTEFWVMKLINDSMAVKILIKKGIETGDKVEITEPLFNAGDRIILKGNYGLADTAKITIQKPNVE